MAHTDLASLFTDIADEIRSKKATTAEIVADNFPNEIASIDDFVPLLCDEIKYTTLEIAAQSDRFYLPSLDIDSKDQIQFVSVKAASFTFSNSGTSTSTAPRFITSYVYHVDPAASSGYREFGESVYAVVKSGAAEVHVVLGAETYFEIEYDSSRDEYYVRSLNQNTMGVFNNTSYRVAVGTRR